MRRTRPENPKVVMRMPLLAKNSILHDVVSCLYLLTYKCDRKIVKHKAETISILLFQNLQRTQILGATSPISHPSSEDPNGAPEENIVLRKITGILF